MDKLSTHSRPRFPSLNPILVDDDVEDDDADDDAMDGGIDRCTRAQCRRRRGRICLSWATGHQGSRHGKDVGRAWAGRHPQAAARASIS